MTVGYDMRWIDTPLGQADKSYFQISIPTMGVYVDVMHGLGMLYPSRDGGPFPTPEGFGTTWDAYSAFSDDNEFTDDALPQLTAFHDALTTYLSWAPGGIGIPSHKIYGTNDGWIVTSAECEQAVAAWDRYSKRQGGSPPAFAAWVEFLRGAAQNGGFIVY